MIEISDCYCTPRFIAERLPIVDLDPCSNPRSIIKARRSLMLERGENGLITRWDGLSIWCNPPYSDIEPWADRAHSAASFCFLVNSDHSTKWWRKLTQWGAFEFKFKDRIMFDAPPGIETSKNDRAQSLVCSSGFYPLVKESFRGLGRWWGRL